jgi:hypothetical protein
MQWSDISFHPPSRTLRQFASLWIVFFSAWAAWQWWGKENYTLALLLAGLAMTIGLSGVICPRTVRLVFVGWMILAFPVGWLISTLCLVILFYLVFLPVGLCFKVLGRDTMTRKYESDLSSYWAPKPQPAGGLRSYFRQF